MTPHVTSTAVGANVRLTAMVANYFSVVSVVVCFLEAAQNTTSCTNSGSSSGSTNGLRGVFRHVARDCMRVKPRDSLSLRESWLQVSLSLPINGRCHTWFHFCLLILQLVSWSAQIVERVLFLSLGP